MSTFCRAPAMPAPNVLMAAALTVLAAACSKPAPPAQGAASTSAATARNAEAPKAELIAWRYSTDDGSVAAAMAQAKADNKPLFLYWGAVWCPPCNQVKSTIFTRADFIDAAKSFVPVYLDGDTASAQKLGKQFRVSGYPTMILFRPDGTEVTRLAGEVEPARYMQLLAHGLSGGASARQALDTALAGKQPLPASDWRLLAYYSWDTSEQTLVPKEQTAATLVKLAAACPPEQMESQSRLRLKAIALAGDALKSAGLDQRTALTHVNDVLASPDLIRANADVLVWNADDLTKAATAPKSPARGLLIGKLDTALDGIAADRNATNVLRVGALGAKVALAKLDDAKQPLPEALLAQVKDATARADRETTDLNERQSVINTAGYVLREAGLMAESDALYKAELARSHSPYYTMSGLASNARKRGEAAVAIDWAQQAYDNAKGPATRLQWGASLVGYLTELAPDDAARIEKTVSGILTEAAATPDALYARNRSSLTRISTRVAKWNEGGKHDAVVTRLRGQVAPLCARVPADGDTAADRVACAALFAPPTAQAPAAKKRNSAA